MYLLLSLLAAIFFALGSMVFKRAYDEGAGVVHAVVVNNVLLAIVFLPLFAFESRPVPWSQWAFPVLTGAAFAAGHLLNVLSLRVGDVSVATPLLGAKVIFVALLARLVFGWPLAPRQWFAALLTTVGVLLMGLTDLKPGRRAGLTTVLALGCAAAFSLTDVMIQSWADGFVRGDGAVLRPELASRAAEGMAVDFRRSGAVCSPGHSHHSGHCNLAGRNHSERRVCDTRIMEYRVRVVCWPLAEKYRTAHRWPACHGISLGGCGLDSRIRRTRGEALMAGCDPQSTNTPTATRLRPFPATPLLLRFEN